MGHDPLGFREDDVGPRREGRPEGGADRDGVLVLDERHIGARPQRPELRRPAPGDARLDDQIGVGGHVAPAEVTSKMAQ